MEGQKREHVSSQIKYKSVIFMKVLFPLSTLSKGYDVHEVPPPRI